MTGLKNRLDKTESVQHPHYSKSKMVYVFALFTDFPVSTAAIVDVDRLYF